MVTFSLKTNFLKPKTKSDTTTNTLRYNCTQKWLICVISRDVNKTFFFLIPGREFLNFREWRLATARQQAYCERDNCHLSITCLLHQGRGPHTRRKDAAKQRTVAYLSGRGQLGRCFFPPGADNPSYATASARQCTCGCFSLPL